MSVGIARPIIMSGAPVTIARGATGFFIYNQGASPLTFTITKLNGQALLSKTIGQGGTRIVSPLATMTPGIYICRLEGPIGVWIKRTVQW